jgi:Domain of unknown function (DUF4105)
MLLTALFGAGAFYYSTIEPDWLRVTLAVLFVVVIGLALLMRPLRFGLMAWAVATLALIIWYIGDRPLNARDWAPEYAVLAAASRDGRTIHVTHVRDFQYRSESDYTPSYYGAAYALDDLETVDLVTSYWGGDTIAHVFLSFGFKDGRYLAFSIETRRQKRFAYSTIAGFFHHFELFYVVADERDLIGVRTDIRHERVYLYRLNIPPDARERLFLSYIAQVQKLAVEPEWYNTIADNCTTGILARADANTRVRYDWRILLSGYAAQLAYGRGLLNDQYSFPDLRQKSLIRRPPGSSIDAGYSEEIRANLPLVVAKP